MWTYSHVMQLRLLPVQLAVELATPTASSGCGTNNWQRSLRSMADMIAEAVCRRIPSPSDLRPKHHKELWPAAHGFEPYVYVCCCYWCCCCNSACGHQEHQPQGYDENDDHHPPGWCGRRRSSTRSSFGARVERRRPS